MTEESTNDSTPVEETNADNRSGGSDVDRAARATNRANLLPEPAGERAAKPGPESSASTSGRPDRPSRDEILRVRGNREVAKRGARIAVLEAPPASRAIPRSPPVYVPPKRSYGAWISFGLFVVLPTLIATIYYGFIASNQYVSEFRFSIKTSSAQAPSSSSSLLSSLGVPATTSLSDNYMVTDYLTSRQAVEALQQKINLKQLYSKPTIDRWARFDPSKSTEEFVNYWREMVTANFDQVTGLAVAQVRAFSPEDAHLIATSLVALSEQLVNQISMRNRNDAVRFAENEVRKAEDRLKAVRGEITALRNKSGVIDPASSIVASNSSLTQTLRAGLAQLETQQAVLTQRAIDKNSPALQSLQSQIKATKAQIEQIESSVGKTKEGSALSTVVARFEQLDLERQFSESILTTTMQLLDQARATAASQPFYVTPYLRPSMPDGPTYPRRVVMVFMVALVSFMLWTIGLLTARVIGEHAA